MSSDDDNARSVRVFVSSTFKDMQSERDILVRRTFPALREQLRARGVEFLDIDLRWGVTEEQSRRGETLGICLSEIDRCRPYFLGLLGERYGWTPPDTLLTDDLKQAFPVLADISDRSVTEIEICHALFGNPETTANALFFFRGPACVETIGPDERGTHIAETDEARSKVNELKARVRASGARVVEYARPEDIDHAVLTHFGAQLEAAFPDQEPPDPFVRTARLHAAFARERCNLHIGAESYMSALDSWLAQPDAGPLLITGASGVGKSALCANWLAHQRGVSPNALTFQHYLGASPDSADPTLLIRRLWEFLDRASGETVEVPESEEGVIEDLPVRLARASAYAERIGISILIALDGLDKLSRAADLHWLPTFLPPRVRLLASSLPGTACRVAQDRQWQVLDVVPLSDTERRTFIGRSLAAMRKTLSAEQIDRIVEHPHAGTPLFLKTLLHELRVFGLRERLNARIDWYLESPGSADLFGRMLERIEGDCGTELVRGAASLIWASRAGLEEAEIREMLHALPSDWSAFSLSLGEALRNQDGRVLFSHDYLRQAVVTRYLPTETAQRNAHLTLADWCDARWRNEREAEELPYQLRAAKTWDRLEKLLTDPARLGLLFKLGNAELLSFWLPLKERGRDLEAALLGAFAARFGHPVGWSPADTALAGDLWSFLEFAGERRRGLLSLAEATWEANERLLGPENRVTLQSLANIAQASYYCGDLSGQIKRLEQLVASNKSSFGSEHPSTLKTMSVLAAAWQAAGDVSKAKEVHQHVLQTRTRVLGPEHLETLESMHNLATIFLSTKDFAQAQALSERVLGSRTRLLGSEHVEVVNSMDNLACVLLARGDALAAQQIQERIVEIQSRILGSEHPYALSAMHNLASTMFATNDLGRALDLQTRVVRARARIFEPEHPQTLNAMGNFALIARGLGAVERAIETLEFVLEVQTRRLGPTHPDTLTTITNLGTSYFGVGDFAKAQGLFEQVLHAVTNELGPDHLDTISSANALASTLRARGDLIGAKRLQERVIETQARIYGSDDPSTMESMARLLETLFDLGDLAGVQDLYGRVLLTATRAFGPQHPTTIATLKGLAQVMQERGDLKGARELLQRSGVVEV